MRLDDWGFVLGVEAFVWIPGTFFRRKNDALASRRDGTIDRGRDDGIKVAPPTEPDRRFSRIRLSRRLGSDSEAEG
jgi:hypothetical protein